jgi:hypothetical protein
VWNGTCCHHPQLIENMVSAEGFEPSTHALKGSSTQLQTRTCTSSLLHARHNKIKEIQTRHRSGCPEGARNPASRTMSLRFAVPNVTRRIHFAEPFSFRLFQSGVTIVYNDLTGLRWLRKYFGGRGRCTYVGLDSWAETERSQAIFARKSVLRLGLKILRLNSRGAYVGVSVLSTT